MAETKKVTRKRVITWLGLAGLVAFLLLNVSAFMQAWRMTHFVEAGVATAKPEHLSLPQKLGLLMTGVTIPKPHEKMNPGEVGLAVESFDIRAKDGVKLSAWYIKSTEGKGTILLFHGYKGCKADLLRNAKVFRDCGWDVVLVDFRGCGDSDGLATTIGVKEAMDVAAADEWIALRSAGRPVVMFGVSMGAAAVLKAIDNGWVKPAGIIIECPFDRLLTTVKHRFEAMSLPTFPLAELLVFWGGMQHGYNGFLHNPVSYAGKVSCPVLLLHGAHDKRVNLEEVKSIQRGFKGQSKLYIFPEAGHESYCKTAPAEYRSVVEEWLGNLTLKNMQKPQRKGGEKSKYLDFL